MPYFHNGLGVFLFIVKPILFLIAYFTLLGTVETKVLFLYFTFTLLHTILVTLWFFITLIDVFEGLKMQNGVKQPEVAWNSSKTMLGKPMRVSLKEKPIINV